ncbi:MAG: hypothetical protein RIR97_1046 [Pseudomonadota bacterium]
MRISSLHIYPVKSGRGLAVDHAEIDALGLSGDRRAAFLDADGAVLEQRDTPMLAQIAARQQGDGLLLSKSGHADVLARPSKRQVQVKVWDGPGMAFLVDDESNHALSNWFDQPVKLAFIDPQQAIHVDADWQAEGAVTGFTDGFPVLITTLASLAALNGIGAEKGECPVPMDRFRANIVIDCQKPWDEDEWEAIEINGLRFDLVKPCARCIMTTQDQVTGLRDGPSPMPAMQQARLSLDRRVVGPLFGWNAIARGRGIIRSGASVTILSRRHEAWPVRQPA